MKPSSTHHALSIQLNNTPNLVQICSVVLEIQYIVVSEQLGPFKSSYLSPKCERHSPSENATQCSGAQPRKSSISFRSCLGRSGDIAKDLACWYSSLKRMLLFPWQCILTCSRYTVTVHRTLCDGRRLNQWSQKKCVANYCICSLHLSTIQLLIFLCI